MLHGVYMCHVYYMCVRVFINTYIYMYEKVCVCVCASEQDAQSHDPHATNISYGSMEIGYFKITVCEGFIYIYKEREKKEKK